MVTDRKKFQGVLNILNFNRHFYVIGLLVLAIILTVLLVLKTPVIILWIIIAAFTYGLLTPLLVSAYVYDFSGYYNFNWLKKEIDTNIKKIVNINAGFDETSFILQKNFPTSEVKVFDFYNAEQHTEPAIVRARKVSLVFPKTSTIKTTKIPLEEKSIDLLFLLSAAHEIRSLQEKVLFLKECRRVCKPTGKVIIVEHLRDLPNFFAFSVGFTHFFSKKTWQKVFKNAGFTKIEEKKFTPFMSVFTCSS
ncbi:class I SAM-dependent methyltransferase [Cellulophaga sp. 20_2_10]|uniref:class I SAM-dependent methyltransferase n=1 Tax=Cellulophaga sp. 20_2_10 TaxID=2942476 RepID=UPI00201ADB0F|nr:methyltransferase domain-containing protein [Cellulophaga sp. 20_2_10]MCL5245027.1 class I SAM-dependent methyltransferase [Cellulophaga sp. 20_2_10]